jgi:hypothetical protein
LDPQKHRFTPYTNTGRTPYNQEMKPSTIGGQPATVTNIQSTVWNIPCTGQKIIANMGKMTFSIEKRATWNPNTTDGSPSLDKK